MNKIIYGLVSEEEPKIAEWGEKRHVPLNVESHEETDGETGEVVTKHTYDLVEKVEQPIGHDTILEAAIAATFSQEELEYVTKHFTSTKDKRIAKYKKFVKRMEESIAAAGYGDAE